MVVDINSLLLNNAGIRIAKADWSFARDGGGQYTVPCQTEIIPAGSMIIGWAILTTVAITTGSGAVLRFMVGPFETADARTNINEMVCAVRNAVPAYVTDKDTPIISDRYGGTLTAGAAKCWIFYLPT